MDTVLYITMAHEYHGLTNRIYIKVSSLQFKDKP